MAVVTISKTAWAVLVADGTAPYSAQTRASHGFEVFIGSTPPIPTDVGLLIPGGVKYAATRVLGDGLVYGRVPSNAPYDTAPVVVMP